MKKLVSFAVASLRPISIAIGVVFMLSAALTITSRKPTFAQTVVPPQNPALGLHTVSLNLTSAQLDPLEGNGVIRAFVPTGSKSVNCLATLNEIKTNVYPTGMGTFAAPQRLFAMVGGNGASPGGHTVFCTDGPGNGWDPTNSSSQDAWENQAMFNYSDTGLSVINDFAAR